MISVTLTAHNDKAYDEASAYVGKIAKSKEFPQDEMEESSLGIIYFLDNKRKQVIYTNPEKRTFELRDVDNDIEGLIKYILKSEIRSF